MGDFKPNYGSKSGGNVYVSVAVPLIANPPPKASDITWSGPTGRLTISSTVSQQSAIYKHLVRSSIPVQDPTYFGNYTMKFNRESIVTVIISAEGSISKCLYCLNWHFFVINYVHKSTFFINEPIVFLPYEIRKGNSEYKS